MAYAKVLQAEAILLCTGIVFSTMGPVWLKTLPEEKARLLHYFTAKLQAEINSKTQFFRVLTAFVKEILSRLHWLNTVAHLNDHTAMLDDHKTPILTVFSKVSSKGLKPAHTSPSYPCAACVCAFSHHGNWRWRSQYLVHPLHQLHLESHHNLVHPSDQWHQQDPEHQVHLKNQTFLF